MPFYTFQCPNCNLKKEVLQSMNSPNPKCEDCATCGCNRVDGTCGCDGKMKSVAMKRVFMKQIIRKKVADDDCRLDEPVVGS